MMRGKKPAASRHTTATSECADRRSRRFRKLSPRACGQGARNGRSAGRATSGQLPVQCHGDQASRARSRQPGVRRLSNPGRFNRALYGTRFAAPVAGFRTSSGVNAQERSRRRRVRQSLRPAALPPVVRDLGGSGGQSTEVRTTAGRICARTVRPRDRPVGGAPTSVGA
jgi:hypothetical protein